MNKIFNKRFWKYFVITFIIMQLLATGYAANQYIDKFISYSIPFTFVLEFSLIASLLILTSSLCCATALSSFVTFRNAAIEKVADFFKLLGMGLMCFLALAFALYLYECNIQPQIKAQSMEMIWDIKTYSSYPERIKDKLDKNRSMFENPDFKNTAPITFSGGKLQFMLDSIEGQRNIQALECKKLLEMLPSQLAREAYKSYKLEEMGVEYQSSQTTEIDSDSLYYIQQVLLYDQATELAESSSILKDYRIESYKRAIGAVCLLLSYLLFAILGYCLRSERMTKIFGIVALVIVSIYLLHATNSLFIAYLKQLLADVR